MPAETPVTIPVEPTVALVLEVLHVPPGVASLRVVVPPLSQRLNVPDIAAGAGLTVTATGAVLAQPPDVVPVTVYTVVTVGVAVTVAPVVADSPEEGAHVYTPPMPAPEPVIDNPLLPAQIVPETGVVVMVGKLEQLT